MKKAATTVLLLLTFVLSKAQDYRRASIDLSLGTEDLVVLPTLNAGFFYKNFGFDYRLSYGFGWVVPSQLWMQTGIQYRLRNNGVIVAYPVWFRGHSGLGYQTPSSLAYRYQIKDTYADFMATYWFNSLEFSFRISKTLDLSK